MTLYTVNGNRSGGLEFWRPDERDKEKPKGGPSKSNGTEQKHELHHASSQRKLTLPTSASSSLPPLASLHPAAFVSATSSGPVPGRKALSIGLDFGDEEVNWSDPEWWRDCTWVCRCSVLVLRPLRPLRAF